MIIFISIAIIQIVNVVFFVYFSRTSLLRIVAPRQQLNVGCRLGNFLTDLTEKSPILFFTDHGDG
jgi:hypothetical protein